MTTVRSEVLTPLRRRCFGPVARAAPRRQSSAQAAPSANSPAAPSAAPSAKQVGRYRLLRRLGAGGTAEVFEAALVGAEGFTRTVAVKRILPGLEADRHYAAMFLKEARLAARLSHPNVVSVLDFDHDEEGRPFIVMEHVSGVDLSELARSGPVPCSVAIAILAQTLSGLGYLHDLPGEGSVPGLVHRDLSPRNVLLSWNGTVKIADFGLAKATDGLYAPPSFIIRGTTGYMSPEQVNGEELDGRSDLFAVGVLLWELLAGRKLFAGTPREIIAHVLLQAIERPSAYRPGIPEDLERFVMRLLSRDPAARYQTAGLALDEVASCRDAPRDGRGELARFLTVRFAGAAVSSTRTSGRPAPPTAQRSRTPTVTASSLPPEALPPWRQRAEADESALRATARVRRRRWMRILSAALIFMIAALLITRLLMG